MPGAPLVYQIEKEEKRGSLLSLKNGLYVGGFIFFLLLLLGFAFFQKPGSCLHLPRPLPEFVGRKEIFKGIEKGFSTSKREGIPTVSLWGEGGIGKTEAAIYYANKHLHKYSFICWINAGSKEVYKQSYRNLAEYLNLPVDDKTRFEKVRRKVHQCLEEKKSFRPWLLIFDNVEISLPMPQRGHGRILFTSRNRMNEGEQIEIPLFCEEDVEDLYKYALDKKGEREWMTIVKELNFFPLAVTQAVHYIKGSSNLDVKDFAKYLSHGDIPLFNLDELSSRYPHTLSAIWEKSQESLRELSPKAHQWLQLCAFLHPDQIPTCWVTQWLRNEHLMSQAQAELEGDEILKILSDHGHIHLNPKTKAFTIHRLKQNLIIHLSANREIVRQKALQFLVDQVKGYESIDHFREKGDEGEKEAFIFWEANATWWLAHHQSVSDFVEEAFLEDLLGNINFAFRAKFAEAMQRYDSALTILEKKEGKKIDFLRIHLLLNKGYCHEMFKELLQAEKVYNQALSLITQYSADEIKDLYIFCLRRFGELAHWSGDVKKGVEWQEKALAIYQKFYPGRKDYVYAEILKWLSGGWKYLGDLNKALDSSIESLQINLDTFGEKQTMQKWTIVQHLGYTLSFFSEYDLALKFCHEAFRIHKKTFPLNFSDDCFILYQIAQVYNGKGNYKKALEYSKKVDNIMDKYLDSKNRVDYIVCLIKGAAYIGLSKPEKGIDLLSKGAALNPNLANSQVGIWAYLYHFLFGDAYFALGEIAKAIAEYDRALEILRINHSEKSWYLFTVLTQLSKAWQKLDRDKGDYYELWAKEVEKNKPQITKEQKQALLRMI